MKELLSYIVKALVDNPDEINITERTREDGELVLELSVAQSDMGKVIGRQGRIVKAIRSVVKSAAAREKIRVSVDIIGCSRLFGAVRRFRRDGPALLTF